ncbi:nucleotidyl transferase AbiEii/AbiGii toxin family protein [Photorhabdus noenieputensis]|uniref:nucleotidyl transferase AbiEii/AbiGii toxin family protein n=1 Tax=Photorhabdus noenieputensis TaxID=1208607 RepID=UPI001BD2371D|nr:nucleotidyl transferase AbiEii/AbiGii toxin family protein [Photorhabdus noenieputensis]MBS9439606.1 nucleotidyl transferase AbiEii/AbiGii toxin family protein [Photorhabdus noenieputensis]MCK3668889.1 nucleotidyl transferase AbiEii/AbiGii toxin family protein [Photorhabdus noenieputensis]
MEYFIEDWIADAPQDRITFRQAVHIVLQAIASNEYLKPKMIMKGGILLGLRYQSSRFTEDIDFSTNMRLADIDQQTFHEELDDALAISSAELPYQVTCAVQSLSIQPRNTEEATFPSFRLKIGYARNNNNGEMRRLRQGQSPHTVKIDYSLNEHSLNVDHITLTDDNDIQAYSFTDLVAEKIRSVIQQIVRNRSRRQDIYDLNLLLDSIQPENKDKLAILTTLLEKSTGRLEDGMVNPETLGRVDIRERSSREYELLKDEVEGELMDFDTAYTRIVDFYKSLPWDLVTGWQNVAK